MLRHIVMWTVNDPADAETFATELRSCKDLVPGMREFDVGVRTDGLDANQDIVLVSTFDDAAALQAYVVHPHHQKVVATLKPMGKSRAVLDFSPA